MIIAGSSYWNNGIGLQPGDVAGDAEGMTTMENLGKKPGLAIEKDKLIIL